MLGVTALLDKEDACLINMAFPILTTRKKRTVSWTYNITFYMYESNLTFAPLSFFWEEFLRKALCR